MEKCSGCEAQKPRTDLKRCSECKDVWYCNVECQRADWQSHESSRLRWVSSFATASAPAATFFFAAAKADEAANFVRSHLVLVDVNAERSIDAVWEHVQVAFREGPAAAAAHGAAVGKPSVVFVLGGPGSGKGTQCARISETFGYVHLSAGDLLREERAKESSAHKDVIESCIKEGKLVPVEITVMLIEQKMRAVGWAGGKYLIDGFPRSQDNLDGWNTVLGDSVTIDFCLFFDVSEAVMTERLLERGKTSGRSDDNAEAIKKRFVTFRTESLPVVEKYRKAGTLVGVNAERSIDDPRPVSSKRAPVTPRVTPMRCSVETALGEANSIRPSASTSSSPSPTLGVRCRSRSSSW